MFTVYMRIQYIIYYIIYILLGYRVYLEICLVGRQKVPRSKGPVVGCQLSGKVAFYPLFILCINTQRGCHTLKKMLVLGCLGI